MYTVEYNDILHGGDTHMSLILVDITSPEQNPNYDSTTIVTGTTPITTSVPITASGDDLGGFFSEFLNSLGIEVTDEIANILLLIIFVLLAIIAFMFYRSTKQKKKIITKKHPIRKKVKVIKNKIGWLLR